MEEKEGRKNLGRNKSSGTENRSPPNLKSCSLLNGAEEEEEEEEEGRRVGSSFPPLMYPVLLVT